MKHSGGKQGSIEVRPVRADDRPEWVRLRTALWPTCSEAEHDADILEYLKGQGAIAFVATRPNGGLAGFVEASVRGVADGCETRPVGYVEGWYVDADVRRQRICARLFAAAEEWAQAQGFAEMGSDCLIDNGVSLAAHIALGYEERERLIHFRKRLSPRPKGGGD